jgi:hypothetical protein
VTCSKQVSDLASKYGHATLGPSRCCYTRNVRVAAVLEVPSCHVREAAAAVIKAVGLCMLFHKHVDCYFFCHEGFGMFAISTYPAQAV